MGLPRGRRPPCHQYQLREIRQTLLPISKRAFRKITSSNRSSPLNPDAPCFKPSTSPNPNVSNNPLNNSQIKIHPTNARSLLPKMTELQMITNALQPDIIAVTETWLSKSVPDNLLALPSYNIVMRTDRPPFQHKRGGGVLFLVHDSVQAQHRPDLQVWPESTWIEMETTCNRPPHLGLSLQTSFK